jgi:hypothetical protein
MAESAGPKWSIQGEYMENCNCDLVCPCAFSSADPFTSTPTQGVCDVAFAFHLDRGNYGETTLDGLNAAVVAHTPGPMINGNWKVALYIDDRADADQAAAIQAIFSGANGGVMGGFAPLIGEVLGARSVPISFSVTGKRRSVEIANVLRLVVRPLATAVGPDVEIVAVDAHPFAPAGVVMAVGEDGNTWSDYGMSWDNSGKNGHYGSINWSNA